MCRTVGSIAQRGCVRQHVCMMTPVCVGSVESGVTSGDRSEDSSGCHWKVKHHYVHPQETPLKAFKAHPGSIPC